MLKETEKCHNNASQIPHYKRGYELPDIKRYMKQYSDIYITK